MADGLTGGDWRMVDVGFGPDYSPVDPQFHAKPKRCASIKYVCIVVGGGSADPLTALWYWLS